MKTLAELLDAAQKGANLPSDYALAKQLGVHGTYISAVRNGRRWPSRHHIPVLAEMIGMESAELYSAIEIMKTGDIDLMESAQRMLQKLHSKAAGIGGLCMGFQVVSEVYTETKFALCILCQIARQADIRKIWRLEFPLIPPQPAHLG